MRRSVAAGEVLQVLLRHRQRDGRVAHGGIRDQLNEGAFQLTHVGLGLRRDEDADVFRQVNLILFRDLVQDRHLGFEIGRLDIDHQAPLKARAEAFHQARHAFRRANHWK